MKPLTLQLPLPLPRHAALPGDDAGGRGASPALPECELEAVACLPLPAYPACSALSAPAPFYPAQGCPAAQLGGLLSPPPQVQRAKLQHLAPPAPEQAPRGWRAGQLGAQILALCHRICGKTEEAGPGKAVSNTTPGSGWCPPPSSLCQQLAACALPPLIVTGVRSPAWWRTWPRTPQCQSPVRRRPLGLRVEQIATSWMPSANRLPNGGVVVPPPHQHAPNDRTSAGTADEGQETLRRLLGHPMVINTLNTC